jgi:FixJ family two-component response regulator
MPTLEWKIMLVDDDREDYILIRDIVNDFGGMSSRLSWTAKYDVALEELTHDRHDVFLIDYRLGAQDGLELMREARAAGGTSPMILLTGQGDRSVDLQAMEAGAADYLEKGCIDAALLERSIRYAIEHNDVEARLAESNAKLRAFAGTASADLAEPLQHVTACLDRLQRECQGKFDTDTEASIARACDAAGNMTELINNLTTRFSPPPAAK